MFFKNPHISFAENDEAFPSLCSNCLQMKQSLRSRWTDRQTHKQTTITLCLPPSTLGLINKQKLFGKKKESYRKMSNKEIINYNNTANQWALKVAHD